MYKPALAAVVFVMAIIRSAPACAGEDTSPDKVIRRTKVPIPRANVLALAVAPGEDGQEDHLPSNLAMRLLHERFQALLEGPGPAVSFVRGGATVGFRWPFP